VGEWGNERKIEGEWEKGGVGIIFLLPSSFFLLPSLKA
jgi:hypothetical protein